MGSAEERFVQAVRLASCDLNVKIGGGQAYGCATNLWVSFYAEARYSQKSSHRALRMQHLKAIM